MSQNKFLIKVTHDCNLKCSYCYDKQFKKSHKMNIDMVDKIAKLITQTCKNPIWIWHGGEPLMMGIEFYKDAVNILKKYNIKNVSCQTNATLLNEEYIKLFKDNNWDISSSFDGINNDKTRGLSCKLIKNLELYLKLTNKKMPIIRVVDNDSYKMLIDDYEYFKNLDIINNICYNLIFNAPGAKTFTVDQADKYFIEYKKLLYHWACDINAINIRNFDERIKFILGKTSYICSYKGECHKEWLSFDPNGDIYPCDRWYEDKYKIGNISDYKSLNEIYLSEVVTNIKIKYMKRYKHCKDKKCPIINWCNGGCSSEALISNGGEIPDKMFCYMSIGETQILLDFLMNENLNKYPNPILQQINMDINIKNLKTIKGVLSYE